MKRRRNIGGAIAVILIVGAGMALLIPSLHQNMLVRQHFDSLFTALQSQDIRRVDEFYGQQYVDEAYLKVITKYKLKGWEYTKITGQPWPMERQSDMNTVSVNLYYDDPSDELSSPNGRYNKVGNYKYGTCAIVPVTVEFSYRAHSPTYPWFIPRPEYKTGQNWIGPFEDIRADEK